MMGFYPSYVVSLIMSHLILAETRKWIENDETSRRHAKFSLSHLNQTLHNYKDTSLGINYELQEVYVGTDKRLFSAFNGSYFKLTSILRD